MGVLIALALPFAPVLAEQTVVTWPAPGQPVVSSTALFVPYRPAELTATVPCSAIREATGRGGEVTVLATGPLGDGLVLRTDAGTARLQLGRRVVSTMKVTAAATDCRTIVQAGPGGMSIIMGNTPAVPLAGQPAPKVFAFRTDLDARQAAGMTVTARAAGPLATSPSGVKILLIAGQLLAALIALGLLTRTAGWPSWTSYRWRWRTAWVDIGVIGVLAGWAIIGPLTDDDGFATTIARNAALTGEVGNYHRWWNASETPFALAWQLLGPLTQVSLAPLWLRLPSTVLGVATWFVLSRGVLGAALPAVSATVRIRLLAAVCLLAAWLPFNLGVRPEPYVALGVTSVLALLWRARGLAALGWAALVAGLTLPISPTGLMVAAPVVMFAPRIVAILRDSAHGRSDVLARVMLLCGIGAVGLTAIFFDQTWNGLVTATQWHTFFGPALPWYQEPDRYAFLLAGDQDGNAAKRIPVLLTLALLPVVGALLIRRTEPSDIDASAMRMAGVVVTALGLLWLTPSKWSHHFGAAAGLFASFLVLAVVVLLGRARAPATDGVTRGIGVVGGLLVAAAAGLAFSGPNAWWQPAVYDVPWATGPVRPIGLPLDSPLLWVGALALGYAILAAPTVLAALGALTTPNPATAPAPVVPRSAPRGTTRTGSALVAAPAMVAVAAAGTAVVVLLGSFLAAPVRRPTGSLALANAQQLTGAPDCGLADDIQVLPDGEVLVRDGSSGQLAGVTALAGFTSLAGFHPDSPPPDPPGTGMSAELWGSRVGGPGSTGTLTSPWFRLPALSPAGGVAVSVSGRTGGGNQLVLEFGRAATPGVTSPNVTSPNVNNPNVNSPDVTALGDRALFDRVRPDQDDLDGPLDYQTWRSIGLDAAQIPTGADRVRIRAIDATTDPDGWLAVTGPRLRSVVGLTEFLSGRGPVLVSWPQAFLFPCVHNIVGVSGGLADAPRVLIEAPRRHGRLSAITTDQSQGGVFAAIRPFGQFSEVPTRLTNHPEVDWGALRLSADPTPTDTYQRTTTRP